MNIQLERSIGDNAPPPHESHAMHIDDLFVEASGYLNGEPIETEEQASAVSRLLETARLAKNDADAQRKREKAPHDAAAAAVQTLWKPILEKADLVSSTCKQTLAPFLQRKDDEMRAAAEAAKVEAEQKATAARALHASAGNDLVARDAAEHALKDASRAEKAATRADKAKAQATGGSRAVGLRTSHTAEIVDLKLFAGWAWKSRPADMRAFLDDLAAREVRISQAPIPGIKIHTERQAV